MFVFYSLAVPSMSCLSWFVGCCFWDLFKHHTASLCGSHLAFSPSISFKCKQCSHRVVLTWLYLRIPIKNIQSIEHYHKTLKSVQCKVKQITEPTVKLIESTHHSLVMWQSFMSYRQSEDVCKPAKMGHHTFFNSNILSKKKKSNCQPSL